MRGAKKIPMPADYGVKTVVIIDGDFCFVKKFADVKSQFA